MTATFFVVYGQAVGNKSNPGKVQPKHGETEYLSNPEECKFVKVEVANAGATGIKEAQQLIGGLYANDLTQTPIVVASASWT